MQKKSWNLKAPSTWIDHEPEQNIETPQENSNSDSEENHASQSGPDILLLDENGDGGRIDSKDITPTTEIVDITGPSATPMQSDSPKSRIKSAQYSGSPRPSSRVTFREPGETGSEGGTSHVIKQGGTGSTAVTPHGKRNTSQNDNMPYWLQPSTPALSEVVLQYKNYMHEGNWLGCIHNYCMGHSMHRGSYITI